LALGIPFQAKRRHCSLPRSKLGKTYAPSTLRFRMLTPASATGMSACVLPLQAVEADADILPVPQIDYLAGDTRSSPMLPMLCVPKT
jgi:hypothetical protein